MKNLLLNKLLGKEPGQKSLFNKSRIRWTLSLMQCLREEKKLNKKRGCSGKNWRRLREGSIGKNKTS